MDPRKKPAIQSALKVNEGVEPPPVVNLKAVQGLRQLAPDKEAVHTYVQGIQKGDRNWLSQAITLVESTLPAHRILAAEILADCQPMSGNSIRIGITGVPGVGKSTFIEAFGQELLSRGRSIAVLAIDPSSQRSKGSILGDKTRMETLASHPGVYIRPSPSSGTLGGVARKTRESMILCEAAGFDTLLIETVGVGQSETSVHSMVDFFLLLMLAGAGDELQGIKRGIMEMADAVVINKADGDNLNRVNIAKAEITNALHYFPPTGSGWVTPCLSCSSLDKTGIDSVADMITAYVQITKSNGFFDKKRDGQALEVMQQFIDESLRAGFYADTDMQALAGTVRKQLLAKKINAYSAGQILLDAYYNSGRNK